MMDWKSKVLSKGYLTINEGRILDGMPALKNEWDDLFVGLDLGYKQDITQDITYVACVYCQRPNVIHNEVCASCGAPLPL